MRAYIPDLAGCFKWLDENGFRYVVLREPEIYRDGFPKPGSKQDVDILVDDGGMSALEQKYGKGVKWRGVKCDIYSKSGFGKGAYHGHPYFPERLASSILENRRDFEGRFYVPSAEDHYHALLYHIAFQKAEGSKIAFDDPKQIEGTKYFRPLVSLSEELGKEMPTTLRAIYEYLKSEGLNIPLRWLRKDVVAAFKNEKKSFFQAWMMDQLPGEFNSFVIRKTAKRYGKTEEIVDTLKQHYEIMGIKDLGFWDQKISARQMRGNKWRNGGPPVQVVLVFDPKPCLTNDEDRKIHPFVFNNRQFFKRQYRENYLKTTGAHRKANPIHSTDNEAEAIGHLPLFFDEQEVEEILTTLDERRASLIETGA